MFAQPNAITFKPMRIALTGSHRVGKTTLAEALANSLPGYELLQEPYLQLEESGYLFSEIPTQDDYIAQFNCSIKQIQESGDDVIFDRCPLDLLAYVFVTSKSKSIQSLYTEMTDAISQLDLIVYVPIQTPDIIFCDESDLPKLRCDVNEIIQSWIGEYPLDVLTIHGSLDQRKMLVLNSIIDE